MSEPFASMSAAEAARFMAASLHPIREMIAAKVGDAAVLDLGCGRGIRIREFYSPGQYFGIDCSPELIKRARADNPEHSFAVAEMADYCAALAPKSVTNAVIISVLEHTPTLEIAQRLYQEARRVARTLYVGWHTPPRFPRTELIKVQAELDQPIWQNRYAAGTFDGGAVDVQRIPHFELWTVRD